MLILYKEFNVSRLLCLRLTFLTTHLTDSVIFKYWKHASFFQNYVELVENYDDLD